MTFIPPPGAGGIAHDPRFVGDLERAMRLVAEGRVTPAELAVCLRAHFADPAGRPLIRLIAERSAPGSSSRAMPIRAERLASPMPGSGRLPARGLLGPDLTPRSTPSVERTPVPSPDPVPPEVEAAMADPRNLLGHHVLLEELGRGGMGVVRRAYDLALHRAVAIKMILNAEQAGEQAMWRFAREARAVARLSHPNIVGVHDVGERDGLPYLVMDYVEGEGLDVILQQGPLAPRRAAKLAHDLCGALAHAHAEGVIHRDIKPQNILVDHREGRPRLTDFGLAREERESSGITRTGAFLGTPGYAPPEQVSGSLDRTGPLSDVYALGAVLFHLTTGRAPFVGATVVEVILASIQRDPPPPSSLNDAIHADLETIILRCLEKDPARRYPSAGDLGEDLRRFLDGEPILARPVGRASLLGRWVRRNPLLAAFAGVAAVVVAVGLVAGALYVRAERRRVVAQEREARLRDARDAVRAARAAFEDRRAAAPADGASPEERRRHLDDLLALGLEALQACSSLVAVAPGDRAARESAFDAAMRLGEVAQESEQWSLAASAFGRARALGIDETRAREAIEGVERARTAVALEHRRIVEKLLEAARTGELADRPGGYEDALFALVGLREAQTVELLCDALDGVTAELTEVVREVLLATGTLTPEERRMGEGPVDGLEAAVEKLFGTSLTEPLDRATLEVLDHARDRVVDRAVRARAEHALEHRGAPSFRDILAGEIERALGPGRVLLARLCCESLGRIGIRGRAIESLARYAYFEADELRAVPAGIALCLLGGRVAEQMVRTIGEDRFGTDGPFWRRVSRFLGRDQLLAGASAAAPGAEETSPTTAEGWFRAARRCAERGDLAEAREGYDRAIELDPTLVEAWINRGNVRDELGDSAGAIDDATRAIELAPRRPTPLVNRSIALAKLGRLPEALRDAEAAVALDPTLPVALMHRSSIYLEMGRGDEALADATRAIEADGALSRAWRQRGIVLVETGRRELARADFERAVALDPRDGQSWTSLGTLMCESGDYREGIAALSRAIELEPRSWLAFYNRALCRKRLDDLAGAIADATRCLELAPDYAPAFSVRGNARRDQRDPRGAIADLDRAIALEPQNVLYLSNRANACLDLGDADGAQRDLERVLALEPRRVEAIKLLGNCHAVRGELAEALAAYDRALAIAPRATGALTNKGAILRRLGRPQEALAVYDRAIEVDPACASAYNNRGNIKLELGDPESAAEDFTRAMKLEPFSPNAWYNRGLARAALEGYEGAIADATRAVELDPRYADAYELRGRCRLRMGDPNGTIADLTAALELEPRRPNSLYDRARARRDVGDRAGAIADLEHFLRIAPSHAKAGAARQLRDALRAGG